MEPRERVARIGSGERPARDLGGGLALMRGELPVERPVERRFGDARVGFGGFAQTEQPAVEPVTTVERVERGEVEVKLGLRRAPPFAPRRPLQDDERRVVLPFGECTVGRLDSAREANDETSQRYPITLASAARKRCETPQR
ncbi:MAG: hypothetical protein U5L04_05620 [Trueperaceae bacterium]|nr:hypothetical protein [Trueperaceae bacterium]